MQMGASRPTATTLRVSFASQYLQKNRQTFWQPMRTHPARTPPQIAKAAADPLMKDVLVCMTNDPSNAEEFEPIQQEIERQAKKAYCRQLQIARGRGAAKRHAKKAKAAAKAAAKTAGKAKAKTKKRKTPPTAAPVPGTPGTPVAGGAPGTPVAGGALVPVAPGTPVAAAPPPAGAPGTLVADPPVPPIAAPGRGKKKELKVEKAHVGSKLNIKAFRAKLNIPYIVPGISFHWTVKNG